jgi:predicted phosphodiesterase
MTRIIALILGLLLASVVFLIVNVPLANAWKFAAVGDIVCKDANKVASAIKKDSNPRLVILLGDLGYGSTAKCVKDAFDSQGLKSYPTVGNHDTTSDIKKVWSLANEMYTLKRDNVQFVSLNTEKAASDQKDKVQNILNKFKVDPSVKYIIPFEHKAMVTNPSAHHKESEAKGFRQAFVPMYNDNGKVPLVLFGHNHGYQQCSDDQRYYITAGTGGRSPYPWGSSMDDNCKNNISGTSGYLEVDINSMIGVFKDLNGKVNQQTSFKVVE